MIIFCDIFNFDNVKVIKVDDCLLLYFIFVWIVFLKLVIEFYFLDLINDLY